MKCPECGAENREDATACVQCGLTLVILPPSAGSGATIEWADVVTILETGDPSLLAVVQSLLEAEGIPCQVQGEGSEETLGLGPLPGATGLVRLQVAREDEEAARALLAAQGPAIDAPPAEE